MKVLIIEDEKPAAEKLILLLHRYDPDIEITGPLTSVEKSISFLNTNKEEIQLIFQDIQLTDGLSFDIFKQIKVDIPIIFTTAFNEHAIEAFKVNSIDYLLKPILYEDLVLSLEKYKSLAKHLPTNENQNNKLDELLSSLSKLKQNYKTRFLVKLGERIKSISTDDIALFYAEGRTVFVLNNENRKFIIDNKLEDLTNMLDPEYFFRVSRTYIVNFHFISEVVIYSNSRLKIKLKVDFENEIIVSREKVGQFKEWFSGNG